MSVTNYFPFHRISLLILSFCVLGTIGWATPEFVVSPYNLPISEGGNLVVSVWLSEEPAANVSATVTRQSGDANITISAGSPITIPKASWQTPVTFTLAAAQDADNTTGKAVIRIQETTANGIPTLDLNAFELDDDNRISVGGTLTSNTTWNDTTKNYLITSKVIIPSTYTLTIGPNVVIQHDGGNHDNFLVQGKLTAATDTVIMMRLHSSWDASWHRKGIVVEKGRVELNRSRILAYETRETGNLNEWAQTIIADASSQLSFQGCEIESLNTNSGYRVPYGVYINRATTTFSASPKTVLRGFKRGIYQLLGGTQQIPELTFYNNQTQYLLGGTTRTNVTLANKTMLIDTDVTIPTGKTMTLAAGCDLFRQDTRRFTVDGGKFMATNASFGAVTNNTWYDPERRDGILFRNGGEGFFEKCYLYTDENRHVDGVHEWAAVLNMEVTSTLTLKGCNLVCRKPGGRMTGYGVRLQGSAASLILSGTQTNSFTGFRCGIYQVFGNNPQIISRCNFSDCSNNHWIGGDVTRSFILTNTDIKNYGTVTVKPGGTLELISGAKLFHSFGYPFLIEGGTLNANGATFEGETQNSWYDPDRRPLIWLKNNAKANLTNCRINTQESRQVDGIHEWVGAVNIDNQSTGNFTDCRFECQTASTVNRQTGYGVHIMGGTATFINSATSTLFKGFRCGVHYSPGNGFYSAPRFLYNNTQYEAAVSGEFNKTQILQSPNTHYLFGAVTVKSGKTLTLPVGCNLVTRDNAITVEANATLNLLGGSFSIDKPIQVSGTLSAQDSIFNLVTYCHWDFNSRRNGINLLDGSKGFFNRCSLRSEETRWTGHEGDYSTMLYLASNSLLGATDCFFTPQRLGDTNVTRYSIRSFTQNRFTLQGCTFFNNLNPIRIDAIPQTAWAHQCRFDGNTIAVDNVTQAVFNARLNWWGSPTGPTHPSNPGGNGDPVSDRVDYGQSLISEPGSTLSFINPNAGQEGNNLTTAPSQQNVEILGFRVSPPSSSLTKVGCRLHTKNGLEWNQFTNFLLVLDSNGNGNADPSEISAAKPATSTSSDSSNLYANFVYPLTTPSNPQQGYLILADLGGVENGDSFKVDLYSPALGATAGLPILNQVNTAWHQAGAGVVLSNPPQGQVGDNLKEGSRQNNVVLYAFRLAGSAPVEGLELTLSNVAKLTRSTMTSTGLYHDANSNRLFDAGDVLIWSATDISISQGTGYIRFPRSIENGRSYLVVSSFRGLQDGGTLSIELLADKVDLKNTLTVIGSADLATHTVDQPAILSQSFSWNPPGNFGQFVNQADFAILGLKILPVSEGIASVRINLSSVVGIKPGEILNPRLFWDLNDNGLLDGADVLVDGAGIIELDGNKGSLQFNTPFVTHGNYLVVLDFATLANGDEITVSMTNTDVVLQDGGKVSGAIPAIRYVATTGLQDNRSPNMRWTLTYRSPGGTTVMGRYNNAGDKVILGYNTGSAWIYEASSNTPLMMLKDHYDHVEYAGFSADDSAAVTVTRDGAVYIWDLVNGGLRDSMFSDLLVTYAVPSPDLTKLMVITEGKGILLDLQNETKLWQYIPGNASVNAVAYSPNGQYILVGASDKRAYLIDAATGNEIRRFIGHTQPVTAVAFTGNGNRIMTSSTDAVVQLWETDNGAPIGGPPLTTISLQGQQSQGAAVSPGGSRVAMVTGSGTGALLRVFNSDGLELFAINLYNESGGNWGGSLESLVFDKAGQRILVTSRDSDWARTASFRVDNGAYLVSWGPQGRLTPRMDTRPRISQDGKRLFLMTDWGMNVLFPGEDTAILRSPNIAGDRGFDINADGTRLGWISNDKHLRLDNVSTSGFTTYQDKVIDINYNTVSLSSAGDMLIAGDRLYNTQTGDLFANYALPDREAQSAFSPDSKFWGFCVPQDKAMVTMKTANPNAVLHNMMLTDPYVPNRMFYHPDGARIGCFDPNVGVQMYDMNTDLPVGLYRFQNSQLADLSQDGTLLLIGGRNTVRLFDVRTGQILRYFYPQHSSLQNVDIRGLQFAKNDTLIMIAWNYNYVETYERSLADHIEISPANRVLAQGETQTYQVSVVYDDGTRADVTPSSSTFDLRATLETDPPSLGTIDTNVLTVSAGASGQGIVRAKYRESGQSFTADATVQIGTSLMTHLIASPNEMSVVPGVFRNIFYRAHYDDGYETEVTSQVILSTDRPEDVEIAGQSVKVLLTSPPQVITVTGTYIDHHGTIASATTILNTFGLKTQWERYQVTGGGYGLSAGWNPAKTRMAWGSSSGAVCIYQVGITPTQYALEKIIIAHDSPVLFVDYTSDNSLVTVSQEGTLKVWNLVNSATQPTGLYVHDAPFTCAARNGALLALGDILGNVSLYDLSQNTMNWSLPIHESAVRSIAIDVDRVLSGGDDNRVKILQRSDGTLLKSILTHTAPIVSVGFTGQNIFFSVSEDKTASFWSKTDYTVLSRYEFPVVPTTGEVIGGELFIATTNPVATWVYDSNGLLLRWLEHPPAEGKITKYLVDPTGKYLLTGRSSAMKSEENEFGMENRRPSPFSSFQFWETGRGIFRGSLAHSHPLTAAHVSSATDAIFTQDSKRTIRWTFGPAPAQASENHLMETGYFLNYSFGGMDFTADDSILATQVNHSIYLFNTFQGILWKTLHTPGIGPFSISPDGSRMATSDSVTRLWDLTNLSQIREEARTSASLDFRHNDNFLGGIPGDRFIGIWNSNGLMFNGVSPIHQPIRVYVNSTGTRCAAITLEVHCDFLSCTYEYFLEIFDITNINNEPLRVGPPIFLLQTNQDLFGSGEGEINSCIAVSDDTALALVGSEGNRPVKLISTADGSTLREFEPPSGKGELNLGASAVGFANNDRTLMVGWREGFAELFERIPPSELSVDVVRNEGGKSAQKIRIIDGGRLFIQPNDILSTQTMAKYTNGAQLNVTSVSTLQSENQSVATIQGRKILVKNNVQNGQTTLVRVQYEELGTVVEARFTLEVGEDKNLMGDTTGDGLLNYLDLLEFSRQWNSNASQSNELCNKIQDSMIDKLDLIRLLDIWK